jgi:superkiller protein 3
MLDQKTEQQLTKEAEDHLFRKEYASAVAAYEQLRAIHPEDEFTKYDLFHALKEWANDQSLLGNYEEAKKILEKALDLYGEDAELFSAMALVCYKLNQKEAAIENYRSAIQADSSFVNAYLELGNIFGDEQEFDKAIEQYELALKHHPGFISALYNLGWAYTNKGDTDKATGYYRKVIDADPSYTAAYNALGNIYLQQNESDKAIEQYQLALKYDPGYKEALYNLGATYYDKGDSDKASDYYHKTLQVDPTYTDAYNGLGNIFFDNKEVDKAIEQYQLALENRPGYKYPLLNLGRAYAAKKNTDLAIDFFQKAIGSDPDYADAYNLLGNLYFDIGKPDHAIDQYQLALKSDPGYKYALYNLGRAYAYKGETEKAIEFYEKAVVCDVTYAEAYNALGNVYLDSNEHDKAVAQYELALKYRPAFKYGLYNLGRAYGLKKETALAIQHYQKAIEADSTYTDAYNALGNQYLDMQEFDKAIAQYHLALQFDPAFKYAYYNLGRTYNKKGEPEKAIEFYRKTTDIDKSYVQAYNELGNIYLDQKEYDKAIEQFLLATKADPAYKYALYNLGLAYSKKRETDKAIEYYQQAIQADKLYLEAYNALGNIYLDKKEFNKAIAQYQQALQYEPRYKYALYNLGILFYTRGDLDKAITYYQSTVEADESYIPPHTELGFIFQRLYQYDKAEEHFIKTIEIGSKSNDKQKLAEAYYNLGNLYLDKLDYEKARAQYDEALRIERDYVFPQHNKAWIYEKLGEYNTAKNEWKKAMVLYSKDISKEKSDINDVALASRYFYCAEILNNYVEETDPEYDASTIESYYLKAIALDNASVYFRLSLLKFCNKQKGRLEHRIHLKNSRHDNVEETRSRINEYHIQALHQYRTGVELLQKKIKDLKDKSDLSDLGEFYLVMEQYKEAAELFEEAIKLDGNFTRGYIGLGVAASKMENFSEAVKCFKKALLLDPDDLNVQSNLADAYLRSDKLAMAEEAYKKILRVASCHMDAILGLAEHYKMVADKMEEKAKLNDSEEYLKQALELYDDILKKKENFSVASKKLSNDEISAVNYSIGYIKVKLYEINENLGFRPLKRFDRRSHLRSALRNFKEINEGQPDYYKAQTAIKKIDKQFSLDAQAGRKSAPLLIFIISLFICLTMQFFFWWGRPTRKDVFVVNKSSLQNFVSAVKTSPQANLVQLVTGEFTSAGEAEVKLKEAFPSQDSLLAKVGNSLIDKKSVIDFEPVDSAPYALITFGSLIFMVVGLFLRDISKLKVGSIELEKTTSDTISTSPNLGIGR